MNKRQEQILKHIKTAYAKDDIKLNAQILSKKMGCSRQLISREILGLESRGMIERQPKYRPVE